MGQFTVHRNPNIVTQARYPLLLDVQADLMVDLATRAVIPLSLVDQLRRPAFQALTLPTRELGAPVGDLSSDGPSIIAAIELLVKGL